MNNCETISLHQFQIGVPPLFRRAHLQRRRFLERELAREKKTLADFAAETSPMAAPSKLMVTLTLRQFELELAWLDDVEAKLAATDRSTDIVEASEFD